jgi:hypothetical protein
MIVQNPTKNQWFSRISRGVVSLALLGLAVWFIDWENIRIVAAELSITMMIGATAIMLLEFPVLGLRWHLLINDLSSLTLYSQLRVYFRATFFNTFTPGQLGGDAYRFIALGREDIPKSMILGRLLQERVIGLIGFLVFFLLCLAYAKLANLFPQGDQAYEINLAGAAIALGLMAVLLGRPLIKMVNGLKLVAKTGWLSAALTAVSEAVNYGSIKRLIPVFTLTIGGGCVIWTVAVVIVATDVGVEASFALMGMAAILSDLIRLVPITIQGVGVREASFAFVFKALGLDPAQGFVVGAISYLAVWAATLVIGVIGYLLPASGTDLNDTV